MAGADDTAFVGRSAELERMDQCLRTARSGKASSVLVQGAAGIGKSALVRRWLAGLAPEDLPVLRATCDTSEEDLAFGVIGQLTSRVPAALLDRFPLLTGMVPAAEPFQVGAELLGLLGELQSGGPVLIVIDDVQWADRPSAQVLGFVLRRLEADAVLTVLLARSGPAPGEAGGLDLHRLIAGMPHSRELTLTGLEITEVAELAGLAYGRPVGRGTAERLRNHTDGHALYLRTLLAEVSWESVAHGRDVLPVPTSLVQALRRQLDGLPAPARSLVEGIAVVGGPAPLATAARVASVTEPDAALEPLLAQGIVRWWPNQPSTPVSVAHALQREAIVDAIPPRRLRALHAAAAALVDRAASWPHRVAAANGPDTRLARELELAAGEYHASGEPVRAATLLLWASEVARSRRERERLLLTAAARLLWAQQYVRVEPLLARVEAAEPCPLRSLVLGGYGTPRGAPETVDLLTEALEPEPEPEPERERERERGAGPGEAGAEAGFVPAMAGTWLGIKHILDGHGAKAAPLLRDVLAIERLEPQLAPWATGTLGLAHSFCAGARAALREYDTLAPPGSPRSAAEQAIQRAYRGMLQMWAGDLSDAQNELAVALDTARVNGCAVTAEFTYANLAVSQYFLGHWDEAAISADHALVIAEAEEKPWAFSYACSIASWVPAGRGQWGRARELVQRSHQWSKAFSPGFAAIGEAVLAQARGDCPAMLAALRTIVRARPDSGSLAFQTWWRPLYVEALIAEGELADATDALAHLTALGEEAPSLRLAVMWLSGQLARALGEHKRARDLFEEGLGLSASSDDPPLHRAMLAHSHGRLLAQAGEHHRADGCFTQARDLFTALGAQPFLTRYHDDFTDRPSGRDQAAGVPLSGLTDRERDISLLIGCGLTNREIAAKLFISSKTVEYHLSHVYQKLSLSGRRQLRNMVQRDSPVSI
ncbi:AAA family ATPase [Streptomyces sp. NPDC059883]|uniref:helix-turn-helix transcriptional regulator n=1 Tax=unclassified Streptomyces TaxID=2593676 RepID=UPI00366705EE